MILRYEPSAIDAETWNGLVVKSPRASLLQIAEYATAKAMKSSWTVERGYIMDGATHVGGAQVLIRKLPFGIGGFAWINRAPICVEPCTPAIMRAAIEALVRHYAKDCGYYLRIAAPLAQDADTDMASLASDSYRVTATPGWASGRLDLTAPEDVLLKNLRGNWRNKLRKAEQSDIQLNWGTNPDLFAQFIAIYRQFLADRKFDTSVTPEFLVELQPILPDQFKMVVHTASKHGEPLAAILIARYGTTCEYLAGASADRTAITGLGQSLLWRAIKESKRHGYVAFDLGGMEAGVTPKGIFDFKTGVNPIPYQLMNEIEAGYASIVQRMIRAYVERIRNTAQAASQ